MCLRELIPGRAPPAPLEPEGTEAIFSPLTRVISIARTLRSTAIESVTRVSTTLEYEADPTFENEATGSSSPSLPRLGF